MSHPDPVHVSDALSAFAYPGTQRELLRFAKAHGADESVVSALAALPPGTYANSAEVMRTIIDKVRRG